MPSCSLSFSLSGKLSLLQLVLNRQKGNQKAFHFHLVSSQRNLKYDQDDVQKRKKSKKGNVLFIQTKEQPLMQRLKRQHITPKQNRADEIITISTCVGEKKWVIGTVGPGRQSAAFEDRTSGKHQRSCLTTPLRLEEQEMEMDGEKVRERKREREKEREREREREKDRVRHQQRKTERHGGMQLLLQAWKPLIRQVCSSSPSSRPQAGGFLWLTGMWAASPRGGEERLGVCCLIDDPQALLWSDILRNTLK